MEPHHTSELADSFSRYFAITPALDTERLQETWRVRHEVYCEDLGWEPQRADGLETDEFDTHSVACLMRSSVNGSRVGCVRLILCDPQDPDAPLPIETACAATFDRSVFDSASVDRRRIAEVSRLAVVSQYRRRKGESDKPISLELADFGESGQQRFPFIPVGLYLSAFAVAEHLGIDYLLVLTEPRLAKHLGKLGIHIRQIGAGIEHRGLRVPSVIDTKSTIANLHHLLAHLWPKIRNAVAAEYTTAGTGNLVVP